MSTPTQNLDYLIKVLELTRQHLNAQSSGIKPVTQSQELINAISVASNNLIQFLSPPLPPKKDDITQYLKPFIPNVVQGPPPLQIIPRKLRINEEAELLISSRPNLLEDRDELIDPNFDPFNFEKYPKDREILEKYFKESQFYVRLAIWILYKYNWLKTDQERLELQQQYEKANNKKVFIDDLTSVYVPDELLMYWFRHFNPSKAEVNHVLKVISKYNNHLDEMWRRLYKKYIK